MPHASPLNRHVDKIDALGREICQHARLEQRLLPTADLMNLLQGLARAQAPVMDAAQTGPGSWNLSAAVQEAIDGRIKPRQHNHLLSIPQASMIQATEHIFRFLEYSSDIDPTAYGHVGRLQPDIARLLLADPSNLADPALPVRRFCEILFRICRLYDAFSGRRADLFMSKIAAVVENLSGAPLPLDKAFEPAIDELVRLFNAHNDENLELARKLIAKEQGASLQDDAKLMVNREMLAAVDGMRLPLLFVRFLERVWSKYLYITYLRHGVESEEWRSGIEVIRVLAKSLMIRDRDEMFHFYATHVTEAMRILREAAFSIHQDEYLVKNLLERMDYVHMQILSEQEVDLGDDCVEISSAPDSNLLTGGESAHQAPVFKGLRVGDWYKLIDEGLERRCKLIEKNTEHGYCLFTNLSGIRVAKLGAIQLEGKIAVQELLRIESTPLFESALAHAAAEMEKQIPVLERQAAEAERLWLESQQRKLKEEAEAQLRAEQERLRLEEEAHRREQLRQEEERRRKEAEAQVKAEQAARERLLQQTLGVIGRMQPGGWLELIGEDNQRIVCKLGLRIKSSGKLIFVDSLGRKIAEFNRLQLAERIVDGSASIMDYGVAFDDTLGSLINERSEKIKTDEPE